MLTIGYNQPPTRAINISMNFVEQLLLKLTSDARLFVMIAHIQRDERDGGRGQTAMPLTSAVSSLKSSLLSEVVLSSDKADTAVFAG